MIKEKTGDDFMEELRNMLDEAILFYEKYDDVTGPFGIETNLEFWSIEEMHTAFVLNNVKYVVFQTWRKDLFNCHNNLTIYRDGEETNLDIFFIRTLLANINRELNV